MDSLNSNYMMCVCTIYNIRNNQRHTEQVHVRLQTGRNVAAGCVHLSNVPRHTSHASNTGFSLHHFSASAAAAAAAVTSTTQASFSMHGLSRLWDRQMGVKGAGLVPWVGGPPGASLGNGFYLIEAFQSHTNTEKILYRKSR